MNVLFLTVTFLVVTLKVHLNMRTVPYFACSLSFLLIPFVQLMILRSKQLTCSWFTQVVFGSISFPYLSLSNMNNVHNTYNFDSCSEVQHFLKSSKVSQLERTMLSFSLASNTSHSRGLRVLLFSPLYIVRIYKHALEYSNQC